VGTIVRPSRVEDRGAIEHALRACGAFNAEEVKVALEMFDEGVSDASSYALFSAAIEGQLAGYVCVGRAALTESSWYLYWLCVHPAEQGHGIGRALQRHGEAFIAAQGGRRIVLETSGRPDYDRARRFYERNGFQEVGRIEDFYRPGDDCLIFTKVIT
jgi:ribosomal protein S18 acetylase RimI-like enzyme